MEGWEAGIKFGRRGEVPDRKILLFATIDTFKSPIIVHGCEGTIGHLNGFRKTLRYSRYFNELLHYEKGLPVDPDEWNTTTGSFSLCSNVPP